MSTIVAVKFPQKGENGAPATHTETHVPIVEVSTGRIHSRASASSILGPPKVDPWFKLYRSSASQVAAAMELMTESELRTVLNGLNPRIRTRAIELLPEPRQSQVKAFQFKMDEEVSSQRRKQVLAFSDDTDASRTRQFDLDKVRAYTS